MPKASTPTRTRRRGSIMGTAMLFFVVVTVAGTAILSMSTIQRLKTVRNGIDVRLMIAAEAGIETSRGRFTLVSGVQDSWSPWLNNATWTTIDTLTVNGIPVTVQARLFGGASVPTARVRSTATASNKSRTVEYLLKVASFSDYAVFTSTGGTLGPNYKMVGNYFSNGSLDIPSAGAQMFGRVQLTGTINQANGEPQSYTFPIRNPEPLSPNIPFPNDAAQWNVLVNQAETTGLVYGENTIELIFNGTQMTRWFVRRRATGVAGSVGTAPTGHVSNAGTTTWINPTTGAMVYTNTEAANPRLVNADYEFVSETVDIPQEGVIYIRSVAARFAQATDPNKDALGGRLNGFTQQNGAASFVDSTDGPPGAAAGQNRNIFNNAGGAYPRILLISGRLANRRVSIACDHKIIVKQPIVYDTLLNNSSLRRFYNDPANPTGKQSQAALNFPEMLGVMSRNDIHPAVTWWQNLTTIYGTGGVTDDAAETIPTPHFPTDTYAMDGVFLALGNTSPRRNYGINTNPLPLGEMWFHGGLIGQLGYGGGNGNTFQRRNYDWDYRMALTMPPYFLNAYNTSATFIPGTWRTWEG